MALAFKTVVPRSMSFHESQNLVVDNSKGCGNCGCEDHPPFGRGGGQGLENRPPAGGVLWAGCGVVGPASPTPAISPATTEKVWKSPSLCVQALSDGLHLVAQPLVFFQLVGDLFDRMQCRRMVTTTEGFANGRQR